MHKNAVILECKGSFLLYHKMRLKTDGFSAIFGQKAGEFGDFHEKISGSTDSDFWFQIRKNEILRNKIQSSHENWQETIPEHGKFSLRGM